MMKRKNAVAAIIVLFICVAVYLNWNYTNVEDGETQPENFGESKLVVNDSGELQENNTAESEDAASDEETEAKPAPEKGTSGEYFDKARLEKQKARDNAINILKEAVDKDSLSQDSRDKAAESIATLSDGAVSESSIETLVKAKGFADCVALINDAGVNVIVTAPAAGLSAGDTTKIKDIVVSETGFSPGQIKIIEIN